MPTINEQVAERLKEIAPVVEGRVVDLLVDKEVSRRVELISQGLAKLDDLQREQRKLDRPDVESFTAEGEIASQSFSKARLDARRKNAEQTAKLTRAIEKALAGETGDLANAIKAKPQPGGDE